MQNQTNTNTRNRSITRWGTALLAVLAFHSFGCMAFWTYEDDHHHDEPPCYSCEDPTPTDCTGAPAEEMCALDGQTYPTRCEADYRGGGARHAGACLETCAADADCATGTVCAGETGRCEPLDCPDTEAPVCGTDNKTYQNACAARAQHVDVAQSGACPDDCPADDPSEVCGEDGVTYPTPCAASRAHVRTRHKGACGPACAVDTECATFELCSADTARCEPVECPDAVAPVCGVDGVTYDNDCVATAHHVAVAHAGECPPECVADTDCTLGEICEAGACVAPQCPELAPDDFSQEVCGVDDFTYQTRCQARAAHIEVKHEGCCI